MQETPIQSLVQETKKQPSLREAQRSPRNPTKRLHLPPTTPPCSPPLEKKPSLQQARRSLGQTDTETEGLNARCALLTWSCRRRRGQDLSLVLDGTPREPRGHGLTTSELPPGRHSWPIISSPRGLPGPPPGAHIPASSVSPAPRTQAAQCHFHFLFVESSFPGRRNGPRGPGFSPGTPRGQRVQSSEGVAKTRTREHACAPALRLQGARLAPTD